jgi:hypothetical protein
VACPVLANSAGTELWPEIRRRVLAGEISMRQACSEYRLNFRTARKIARHAESPPFRAPSPRPKPVLGPFLAIVRQIIDGDRHAPPKQRHTGRRIHPPGEGQVDFGATGVQLGVAAPRVEQPGGR